MCIDADSTWFGFTEADHRIVYLEGALCLPTCLLSRFGYNKSF